jgi:hypothetical protein
VYECVFNAKYSDEAIENVSERVLIWNILTKQQKMYRSWFLNWNTNDAAENVSGCVFNLKYSDKATENLTACVFKMKFSSDATENV